MTTISATWNAVNGDWSTAADWDEPNPNVPPPTLHTVPGANNDVSILDNNSGNPFTVTYNTTDTVNTLSGANNATLSINGGSLSIVDGGSFSGTITLASAASFIVQGGTESVNNGTFDGAIGGSGTLHLFAGNTALNSTNVTVSNLHINGGNPGQFVTLGNDLTYAGNFNFDGQFDTFSLNGHTLTLSGTSTLSVPHGGGINGPGTLKITGTASFTDLNVAGASGNTAATIEDANAITQAGTLFLKGSLVIDSGATYTFTSPASITDNGSTVTNNGTLSDTASGNSTIQGAFTNNNILSVGTGASLLFVSGAESLNGSISGAGTLVLAFASTATFNTTNVTIAAITLAGGNGGSTFKLGTTLSYSGALTFGGQFDFIDLNGFNLTLSGSSSLAGGNEIEGTGTLTISGTTSLGTTIDTTVVQITGTGTVNQVGGVSTNSTITIGSGGTYNVTAASNLNGGTITNNGTFDDQAAGTSNIGGTFINNNVLTVDSDAVLVMHNTVTLNGSIGGAGELILSGSTVALNATSLTVATFHFAGGNGGANVTLGADLTYGGHFIFADQFDQLNFNGHTLTLTGTVTFTAGAMFGSDGLHDRLVIDGSSVDASALLFNTWNPSEDSITFNGTASADVLTGSRQADTMLGNAGDDVLNGGNGADALNGGAGHDTLTGGSGADKFVFDQAALSDAQGASHIIDRITDYDHSNGSTFNAGEGDQIDVSAITGAAADGGQAASALVRVVDDPTNTHVLLQVDADGTANGISWVTVAQLDGLHGSDNINAVVSTSQPGGADLYVLSNDGHFGDFDNDGHADVLWRNDDGTVATWQINGGNLTGNFLPGVPSSYHILGTADFNADGKSDILWQNDDGSLLDWQMASSSQIGSSFGIGNAPTNSVLVGLGDVDGDHKADLFWRDLTSGAVTVNTIAGGSTTISGVGNDWGVVGVGDYNGDGITDVMFRNQSLGINAAWLMNGTSSPQTVFFPGVPNSWHVAATGDFNGDGTADLFWHNDDGSNAVWLMNTNGAVASSGFFDGVSADWHVVGSGDFDGRTNNGHPIDDLIWRDDNGATAIWSFNGASAPTVTFPGGVPGDWATQAHHYDYV